MKHLFFKAIGAIRALVDIDSTGHRHEKNQIKTQFLQINKQRWKLRPVHVVAAVPFSLMSQAWVIRPIDPRAIL
jgi:hypothetical protein